MNEQTYPDWVLDNPIRRWFEPPRRVVDRLDPKPGDRVVDLGAGVGYYAEEVLSRIGSSGHLTLVDINRFALSRFVQRHGPDDRVHLVMSSATSVLELPDGSQDRLLLADVLCDLPDKGGVLDEAYRILRPGGVAYLSFRYDSVSDPVHPLRLTPAEWADLSRRNPWEEVAYGAGRHQQWHLMRKPVSV